MMRITKNNWKPLAFTAASLLMGAGLLSGNTADAQEAKSVAFPDKYMIRLGSYYVDRANTDITVLDSTGVGVGISFADDLGGETTDSIPRLDGYYRFNDRHRIEFSNFTVDRNGTTITPGLTIGDDVILLGETINSNIKYTTTKVSYGYSFYHSPQVELSLSAGLNITDYSLNYSSSGGTTGANGVTAPLPVFGLQLVYAITPKWSVHYLSESFFIELENTLKGQLLISELDIEYKATKNFAIGAGLTRVSTDLKVNDDDWRGGFTDSHRGLLLYGSLYF